MTEETGSGPAAHGYPPHPAAYGRPWAPKPGIIPLRPLTLGEILDGSFTVLRWNPKPVLIPTVIVSTVMGVLFGVTTYLAQRGILAQLHLLQQGQAGPDPAYQTSQNLALAQLVNIVDSLVRLAGIAFLTCFLTGVIGQAVLGRKETLASAWRMIKPRAGAAIGLILLEGLILGVGWAVAIGVAVGIGAGLGAGAHLVVLGVLLGIVVGITASVFVLILGVRWLFAIPVVVLEHAGPVQALRRSWQLVRGSWWRVFGIMLLGWIIVYFVSAIISLPFGIGTFVTTIQAAGAGGGAAWLSALLTAIGAIVANTVTAPLLSGLLVVLYTDLRMRREGMDISLRTAAAAGGQPLSGLPAPAGTRPPGTQEPGSW